MEDAKVVRIEVEYSNGEIREANGEDAAKIMDWWQASEAMQYIHGARYTGPVLKVKQRQV